MTCALIKLLFVSGSSDLHPDTRARLVISLPLRIRTFPLLLQKSGLLTAQDMHGKFVQKEQFLELYRISLPIVVFSTQSIHLIKPDFVCVTCLNRNKFILKSVPKQAV